MTVRVVVARVLAAVAGVVVAVARHVVVPVTRGPWSTSASAVIDRVDAAHDALRGRGRR